MSIAQRYIHKGNISAMLSSMNQFFQKLEYAILTSKPGTASYGTQASFLLTLTSCNQERIAQHGLGEW